MIMKNFELILDSNIIQYIENKNLRESITLYLSNFSDIFYSEISIAELITGAKKEEMQQKINTFLQMKPITIEQNILILSGQLHTIYTNSKIPCQHISLADRIIAASSISTNIGIFTADVNDFPRPFFQEVEEHVISYQYKNKSRFLITQVLKPNYSVLTQFINRL